MSLRLTSVTNDRAVRARRPFAFMRTPWRYTRMWEWWGCNPQGKCHCNRVGHSAGQAASKKREPLFRCRESNHDA